ncbi:DUF3891 family protein [Nafulsella turpanensis]|uniref:DUF3891 family protein n=1 Tax=Nafulsella turpanensis TaxID=1265690 RepID=UPI00034C483F|nr:DUF3891 family protein [Nafulsella turpanensis]
MIVNAAPEGWEVIFQRAHELLAMQTASFWQQQQRPVRWHELLSAITEHDNQQESWKGQNHLTASGAPQDFSMKGFSLSQARAVTEVSQYKSRYVSLLISMHTSYLYEPLRGKDKATDQFLDDQQALQQRLLQSLKLSRAAAAKAYNLLQWADRCSLILCKNQLPADERRLEVFKDTEGQTYFIWQRKDKSLGVEPWPFQEVEFKVWVERRLLKQLQFKDDGELAKALAATEVEEKEWVFRRQ